MEGLAPHTWLADIGRLTRLKQSVSNSWPGTSQGLSVLADTLGSTATTREWSKDGEIIEAKASLLTECSNAFTTSLSSPTTHSPCTLLMFPVQTTQQIPSPVASTPPSSSNYPKSHSQLISTGSLLIPPSPSVPQNSVFSEKAGTLTPSQDALSTLSSMTILTTRASHPHSSNLIHASTTSSPIQLDTRFSAPITTNPTSLICSPRNYQPHLTPAISHLRPHCAARDRLRLWTPIFSRSPSTDAPMPQLTKADLDRVITVINSAWQPSTRETYGASLQVFHVFCDLRGINEVQRCPVDPLLMIMFISCCAGSYSRKTLANYSYAIRAWHILHGAPWKMNPPELKAALDRAASLAPPSSRKSKCCPLMVVVIVAIAARLDPTKPLDASVYSCLTTTFFSAARLGEFTLPSLKAFPNSSRKTLRHPRSTRPSRTQSDIFPLTSHQILCRWRRCLLVITRGRYRPRSRSSQPLCHQQSPS